MNKINSYKDLLVWQKSINLVEKVYLVTKIFPKDEIFGLTSQIKRSAISIPSNIAEGTGRSTRKDYLQFLHIAYGSLLELETQLLIAKNLGFAKQEEYGMLAEQILEISKMLKSLIKSLQSRT